MRLLAFLGLLLFCVPGHAEQFAVATDNGHAIELHDKLHHKCAKGLSEATYIWPDGRFVDGCWKVFGTFVVVVFEDGDSFKLPIDRFTWKAGKRPASL